MLRKFFSIGFLVLSFSVFAQPGIDSLKLQRDIVKMLRIDSLQRSGGAVTSLTGFSEHDIRETPGDIFILNAEDLEAMNAISLIDVLIQMAPTSLGRDVEDGIGLGVRGLWAQEGKILFMFNGIPLNDLDYGTYLLGGRISLQMVSRIEFNFGPGSVKYGGTAALGVINIVLKNHAEFSGGSIDAGLGFSNGKFDRQNIGFVGNYELNDHYQMTIQVNSNKSKKSTRIQDIGRNRFINWADSSNSSCNNVFIGLRKGKYRGAFYFSDYQAQISDEPQLILMSTLGLDNSVQFKISDKTKLEAQLIYMDQLPWIDLNTTDSSLLNSNTHAQRISQNLVFKSRFGKDFNLDYGVQGNWQQSQVLLRSGRFSYNEQNFIRVGSGALFIDGFYKGKMGVFSIGSRMESHTFSKLLFAPRLGYSFQFQHFYIKTFFAQSFKIATIQNQNGSIDEKSLNHETVTTGEFELGWQYKDLFLKLSAFKTKVFDPILYVYDPELNIDNYINRLMIGTEGLQCNIDYSSNNWSFVSSAMYNRIIDHDWVPELQEERGSMYYGFPMYKYHFHTSYRVMKMFNINLGLTKQGAIQILNDQLFKNGLLIQTGVSGRALKNKNLHFTASLKNILNSDFWIGSPTNSELDPMPLYLGKFKSQYNIYFINETMIKNIVIFCFIWTGWSQSLIGQNSDSLLIMNEQLDMAYNYLVNNENERASKIGLRVLQFARKTNNPQLYAQSCLLLSEQSIRTNELESGVKYACRGMESVKEIDDFLWCNLGVSLCQLYRQYGVADRAIGLAQKIFSRKKLLQDQELRLVDIWTKSMIALGQNMQTENLLNNYFDVHRADLYKNPLPYLTLFETWVDAKSANGKHNEAYMNVINLMAKIEQSDSKDKLFVLNNKAGEICINLKDYNKAITFFNEAVNLNKKNGHSQENYVLLNLARAYYFLGNYQRSFDIAEKSYLNAEKSNQPFQKAITAMFIARLKFAMNNTSSAIDWANTAFRLSQDLGELSIQYHVSILLSELFSMNNEFDRSAKFKLKAEQINEKILLSQQNDKLKRANLNIDIANAEFEAIMELQNFEKQRMVLNEKLEKIQVESERQEEKYRYDLRLANEVLEKERVLNRIQKLESEQLSQTQQFQISELENKRKSSLLSISELKIQKQEADNKNLNLKLKNDKLAAQDELNKKEIEYRKTQSLIGIFFTIFVLIGLIVMVFFYRKTRSQNKIIELSSIEIQNINKELAEKNNEIVAGIEYASKFQEMVYPSEDDLKSFFQNAFIVHRPLEMVSGDLPFVFHVGEEVFVAAVDCIGHGVSASMLSIMTYYGLTDIIRNDPRQSSADILVQLHQRLVKRLSKTENRNYIVSVDLALLKMNQTSKELQFSGANLPLIILSGGEAEMIKGTHLSIGENVSTERLKFDNFNYQCKPGDELFLFSDGFYHQFGGADGKQKLSKKRILVSLNENDGSNFIGRKDQIVALFDDWRGVISQTDDLVIIGIKV